MSEYARRRGCSDTAVRKAVRAGRIALIDGKVDPVAADAQWARNTRVRAGSRPSDDANLRAAPPSAPGAQGDGQDAPPDYWASKARREKTEAEIAEIKLAELQGDLVRRADIESVHAATARLFRESLLQLSSRIAPIIASYGGDEAKIRVLLDHEHDHALRQFSGVTDGHA